MTEVCCDFNGRDKPACIRAFGLECRLLCEAHLPFVLEWRNDPRVLPFMGDTRAVTLRVLQFWLKRISSRNDAIYYMALQDNVPLAFFGLNHIDWVNRTGEVETVINPECVGRKLVYDLYLCQELILQKLGLEFLLASVRTENGRSSSFLSKLAFECTGTRDGFHFYRAGCAARRKALRGIAREKGMEVEFLSYFGDDGRD